MPTDILLTLGLTAEDTSYLSPRLRDRLVHFLLRWKHYVALDACLNELLAVRPLLSLLDARAEMLLEQGRLEAAWQVISERHQRSVSILSRILAARIRLAQHDVQAASTMAKALVDEAQESSMAWGFLGEVRLTAGDDQAALAAYRRVNDLNPDSRVYLVGMMAVYQSRGDWVTASAYAVRLLETATPESPLPVNYLRRLHEYFIASREPNRVADIDAELAARYATELAALREALALELGQQPSPPGTLPHGTPSAVPRKDLEGDRVPAVTPQPAPDLTKSLDSFNAVRVLPQEREKLKSATRCTFGFEDLLPGQAEIMSCIMRGEDVLAVLPTGGGKSLCYQLPALLAGSGTTLVISPLIALMKDQVDKLPAEVSRLATAINSSLEGDELRRRLDGVRAGRYRLVYAAPERLRQPPFLHALRQAGLNRMVIDEVHCVSMWGHDFRPDYLYIAEARRLLGNPPLLAMTATAAPRVRLDILQRLGNMRIIASDVLRSNLRLEVFRAHNADEKLRYLLTFCRNEPGAGIIYAGTRARCEELAELLRSQGISAIHYHAGIENREEVQDEFMCGRTRVIVATIAFGMGIDKPDIRFIIHYESPPSLEAYYQEAGRAGRDGLPARCVLLYAPSDRATLTRRAHRDELTADFLRQTYAAIKRNLQGATVGRVVMDDLRRDLQAEETQVRVAISVLEQAQILRRWQDAPRLIELRKKHNASDDEPALAALCHACRLQAGQSVTLDFSQAGQQAGLDVRHLEQRMLAWAEAGFLEYRPSARDPLLELLPVPKDARERLSTLLDQYEKVQAQRVAEIVAYARTRRCRHGHISAYLGGRAIPKCKSCDNCLPTVSQPAHDGLPNGYGQLQLVLRATAHGWGKRSLIAILRGQRNAPPSAQTRPEFGSLAFRSEQALQRMIKALLQAGCLTTRQLAHGGLMLQLTPAGHRALRDPSALRALVEKTGAKPVASVHPEESQAGGFREAPAEMEDSELFKRLCAWRLEKARQEGVAAFVIAHNALLHNIAYARPRNKEEMLAVKGMGPRKFEKYGAELLAIVQEEAQK